MAQPESKNARFAEPEAKRSGRTWPKEKGPAEAGPLWLAYSTGWT